MTYVTGFMYKLEEYEIPAYPHLMIMDGWLDVSIYRLNGDLEFQVNSVELETPQGKSGQFGPGSFLYDAIVPAIYKDDKISAFIMSSAHEHI